MSLKEEVVGKIPGNLPLSLPSLGQFLLRPAFRSQLRLLNATELRLQHCVPGDATFPRGTQLSGQVHAGEEGSSCVSGGQSDSGKALG